jgi:hypothetical protein
VNEKDLDADDLMEVSITPGSTPDSQKAAAAAKTLAADSISAVLAAAGEGEETTTTTTSTDHPQQRFGDAPSAVEVGLYKLRVEFSLPIA